jgi:hypothetical protein
MVISHGNTSGDSITAYEDSVFDSLVELVSSAPKLTSVILRADVLQLPSRFWNTLLSKPLRHLEIKNWSTFSPDFQITEPLILDKFVLSYHANTAKMLEVRRSLICFGELMALKCGFQSLSELVPLR